MQLRADGEKLANWIPEVIYIYTIAKRPEYGICVDVRRGPFPPIPARIAPSCTGYGERVGYTGGGAARVRAASDGIASF